MTTFRYISVSDYDYVLHLSEHKLTKYQYQRTEVGLLKHVLIRNLLIKAHTLSSDSDEEECEDDEDLSDQPLTFGSSHDTPTVSVDTDRSKEENWFETCFDQLDQDTVDSVIIDYSSGDEDDEDMEDGAVPRWVQDIREKYHMSHENKGIQFEDDEADEEDDEANDILKLASLESSCDYFLQNDKTCSLGSFDPFAGDDVVQDTSFDNKYSWIKWRNDPITV